MSVEETLKEALAYERKYGKENEECLPCLKGLTLESLTKLCRKVRRETKNG